MRKSRKSTAQNVRRAEIFDQLDKLDPGLPSARLAATAECSHWMVEKWRVQVRDADRSAEVVQHITRMWVELHARAPRAANAALWVLLGMADLTEPFQ